MSEAIIFENVSYTYNDGEENAVKALNDVSLSVHEGEFLALVGRNGSGKSTLAKMMNGLILPDKGKVVSFGYDTQNKDTIFEVRKRVGLVFQNPDNQMVASIVEEDIAFGPENLGVKREEIIERVDFALKSVGMEEYRKSTPFKMSGGQKQRIAIAGVLAMLPKALVLDESTAMLDPKGRKEVLDVVKKLNKEEGITVVLITHYMEEALDSDRIAVMDNGNILKEGTPKDIFCDYELIDKAGLKLPTLLNIARRLKEEGVKFNREIFSEEELIEELCQLL